MAKFAIFGAGGLGRELVASARLAAARGGYDEFVFVVDRPQGDFMGQRVISPNELGADDSVVFALGSPEVRRAVAERFTQKSPSLIDPHAHVGLDVELGEGAVMCAYSLVTASVRIGRHFQANAFALVSHDCVIGDFVTLAPRATCNGTVHIGDGAYIGAGAILRNGSHAKPLRIGAGAVVGMGAVVTRDVPEGATVVGNPARPLERK